MNKDIKVSVFFLEITQNILDSANNPNIKAIRDNCLSIDGKLFAPYLIDTKCMSEDEIRSINTNLLFRIKTNSLDINDIKRIVLFPDNNKEGMYTVKYLLNHKLLKEKEPFIISEKGDMLLHSESEIKLSTEEAFKNDIIVYFLRKKQEERKQKEINNLLEGTGVVLPK